MKVTLHHEYNSLAELKADIESMARALGLLDDQRAERMAVKRVFQETEKSTALDEAVAAVVAADKAAIAEGKPVEAVPEPKAPKAAKAKKAAVEPAVAPEKANGAAEPEKPEKPEAKPIGHEDLVKVMSAYQHLYGYGAVEADFEKILQEVAGVDRLSRVPKDDQLLRTAVHAALTQMLHNNPFKRKAETNAPA